MGKKWRFYEDIFGQEWLIRGSGTPDAWLYSLVLIVVFIGFVLLLLPFFGLYIVLTGGWEKTPRWFRSLWEISVALIGGFLVVGLERALSPHLQQAVEIFNSFVLLLLPFFLIYRVRTKGWQKTSGWQNPSPWFRALWMVSLVFLFLLALGWLLVLLFAGGVR